MGKIDLSKLEKLPSELKNMILSSPKDICTAYKLADYDNTVFAFMSPNDLSKLESDLEQLLKKRQNDIAN